MKSKISVFLSAACMIASAGCTVSKSQPSPAQPDMATMMANWQKAMTPGPEHAHLMKNVGVWDGKIKMWMDPSMPAQESVGTATYTALMGGRYVELSTQGEFDMGSGKMPLEGRAIYGYDNISKQFESVWIDNMGTGFMKAVGHWRADGKGTEWIATAADPMTGKMMTMREVETIIDDDHTIFEMFGPGPDGKEFRTMEIQYTRRK